MAHPATKSRAMHPRALCTCHRATPPLSMLCNPAPQKELFAIMDYLTDFPPAVELSLGYFAERSITRASLHLKVQIGQYQSCCLRSRISWKRPKAQTTIPLTRLLIRSSLR